MDDKDYTFLYRLIKTSIREAGRQDHLSRRQLVNSIRGRVKFKLLRQYRWKSEFKAVVRKKYSNLGLESKEIIMVDKMIEKALDELDDTGDSIATLIKSIEKVSSCVSKAQTINKDSEDIVSQLDKLMSILDENNAES